jgi:hypothetical protein
MGTERADEAGDRDQMKSRSLEAGKLRRGETARRQRTEGSDQCSVISAQAKKQKLRRGEIAKGRKNARTEPDDRCKLRAKVNTKKKTPGTYRGL